MMEIAKNTFYIGVDDHDIDLFEGQYIVPNGISYNSYVIMDEKIAVMDTVDMRGEDEWFSKLSEVLGGRKPDYLVVSHMEPDHSGSILRLVKEFPDVILVGNAKTFTFMSQFFNIDLTDKKLVVKEGDTLKLGGHELSFIMAPMVHWPEVMVTYDSSSKILYSADGFGKFGTLDTDEDWTCEARRYYMNIVGKYGAQVQALLKKFAARDIQTICPLHGPILKENLGYYIGKYDVWSSYMPEDKGIVIACASIHGNTKKAAYKLAEKLESKGEKVSVFDLSRDDIAEVVEDAFRYDRLVLASPTYDGGLFPAMDMFLARLKSKGYKKRKVGFMENGTWAPMAAKHMRAIVETLQDIEIIEPVVTIRSALNDDSEKMMDELVDALCQ
ncbi:MAG: FprA family A-type flavoprotein [Lachnospiraceae bacterium]|nr:FprA family A-type flavoprotein [Lachnoclostridium sp.]MDY2599084.1 FprA family A-type flavoprotein [Lachnospiraceae bacterium]